MAAEGHPQNGLKTLDFARARDYFRILRVVRTARSEPSPNAARSRVHGDLPPFVIFASFVVSPLAVTVADSLSAPFLQKGFFPFAFPAL